MPDARKLVYWDACVILSYLEGTPDRLPVLDELLSQSEDAKNDLRIVTSTLSIVEVAFIAQERRRHTADPAVEARMETIWDGSAIDLVEFFEAVAREGRTLMRQALGHNWSLKPGDAVHLATASRMNAAEFHTYDDGLVKFAGLCGFPVRPPQIAQPRLFEPPST